LIKSLDHVGIAVSDLSKSLDFYHRLLGFPVVEEHEVEKFDLRIVFLKAGEAMIELLHYRSEKGAPPPQKPLGLRHLTFLVDDVDEEYKRLKMMGVNFVRAPTVIVPGRIKNAFFLGPDGELIELIERIK